nr:MAG TPA: hypothetical protein [Caudoviricetes sp.]
MQVVASLSPWGPRAKPSAAGDASPEKRAATSVSIGPSGRASAELPVNRSAYRSKKALSAR